MEKFAPNFCYCAVNQEKTVFTWKGPFPGRYCSVDQEKAVFNRKRAVSGTSAISGLEMVKFEPNFSYCAVDQEKGVFGWKRAVSGPSALLGPEMVKWKRSGSRPKTALHTRHRETQRVNNSAHTGAAAATILASELNGGLFYLLEEHKHLR